MSGRPAPVLGSKPGKGTQRPRKRAPTFLPAPCRRAGSWLWRSKDPDPREKHAGLPSSTPRLAVGEMPESLPQGLSKVPCCFPFLFSSKDWGEVAWTEAEDEGVQTKSYGFCWDESPGGFFLSILV